MSAFGLAQQPEILHGAHKDQELLAQLKQRLLDLLERLVPPQQLFRQAHWVGAVAALIYFAGNSLRLQQTLGEEYAYIRQFADRDHVYLTRRRLLLFLCLEVFGEPLVAKVLSPKLDAWIARLAEQPQASARPSRARSLACAVARCLGDAQTLISGVGQAHLCAFYLQGLYASLTKRLAGIKYLQAVRVEQHAFSYRRIGLLMLLHLGLKLLVFAVKVRREFAGLAAETRRSDSGEGVEEPKAEPSLKTRAGELVGARCGICFEAPASPACLPCGHMYCWECAMRSSQFKAECPGCRKPFEPREVVSLSNVEV